MAYPSIEEQIQEKVQVFAEELSGLVRAAAFEAVEQVLGNQTSTLLVAKPRGRVARGRSSSPGKRVRRTAAALESDKSAVHAYIVSNPGQRLEEIAAGMRLDSKGLKRPITLLLEAKKLRKEGQRRGMRYFPSGRGGAPKGTARKVASKKKVSRKKKASTRKKVSRKK
jgi:hypothetical protein